VQEEEEILIDIKIGEVRAMEEFAMLFQLKAERSPISDVEIIGDGSIKKNILFHLKL
jgi:hypothetical protein